MKKLSAIFALVFLLVLCVGAAAQAASVLQTRADATAPGTFSTNMNTSPGYNRAGIPGGIWVPAITGQSSINEFSTKLAYDPSRDVIRFLGQAHGCCYGGSFLKYTPATDIWTDSLTWPHAFICQSYNVDGCTPEHPPQNHEWDRWNAVRPSDGLQLAWTGQKAIAYTPGTDSWVQVGGDAEATGVTHTASASSFVYAPHMAKFVLCVGDYGCWTLDPAHPGFFGNNTSAWAYIACGTICWSIPTPPGQTFKDADGGGANTIATYSAGHGRLYVATGDVGFGYFNASGIWTKLQNCPAKCELNSASMAADPVTGDLILMSQGSGSTRLYAFNGTGWSGALPVTIPSQFNPPGGALSVPSIALPNPYNVIMFAVYTGPTNNGVFLYKHAAAGPDTTPPTAPSGLTVTPVSPTQLNLLWNPATDVGGAIANYLIERSPAGCGAFIQVGTSATTSFSDSGLSPTTQYCYRVRAVDTASLSGPYSPSVSGTTLAASGSDFASRCQGATATTSGSGGVLRCFGFDSSAELPRTNGVNINECWGCDFGIMANSNNPNVPVIDTTTKASGAGSMRFNILAGGGSGSAGSWFTHFGPNKTGQLAQGEGPVYIQWSFMWSPELLVNSNWLGGGGAKISDITLGDPPSCPSTGTGQSSIICSTSCDSRGFTQVIQNNGQLGFPTAYANCSGPGAFNPMQGNLSPPTSDWTYQNMIGNNCSSASTTGCKAFVANQWMTIKVKLAPMQWNAWANPIAIWFGIRGQPLDLIIDCEAAQANKCNKFFPADNGWWFQNTDAANFRMGKIFLHPYQTCQNSTICGSGFPGSPDATVRYDELIISTQNIADPGAVTPPTATVRSQARRRAL